MNHIGRLIFSLVILATSVYCQYGVAPAYVGRFGDYFVPRYVDYAGPAYPRQIGGGVPTIGRGGYRPYGGMNDLPPVMTIDHGLGHSELYRGGGNAFLGGAYGGYGRQYPYPTLNNDPYRLRLDGMYGPYSKS